MTFMRPVGQPAFLFAAALAAAPAAAVVIDDFSAGPTTLTSVDNLPGSTQTQTGLPADRVAGGTRFLHVAAITSTATSPPPAVASIDGGAFAFSAPPDRFGYFELGYGTVSPLGLDLTAGGDDRFVLSVSNVSDGFWRGLYEIRIVTGATDATLSTSRAPFAQQLFDISAGPANTGVITVPFSAFAGADLTRVQRITIDAGRVEIGRGFSIEHFGTVPEPTAALVLTGAAGLLLARRRSR